MEEKTKEFLAFAESAVRGSGKVLLTFRDSAKVEKTKDSLSMDIATSADYASEKYTVSQIQAAYPGHSIFTEETQGLGREAEYEWIIDPLDGTKEFVRHIPYYYTLLALEYKGGLLAAAGYQPEIDRLFSCAAPDTARVNGRTVAVSRTATLEKAFVSIALPNASTPPDDTQRWFQFLKDMNYKVYKLRNTCWDVESLFNVAMGAHDGYIIPTSSRAPGPKWWDIAPGILMVQTAGGRVSDFYGNPIANRDISRGILASNGILHEKLLAQVKERYLDR